MYPLTSSRLGLGESFLREQGTRPEEALELNRDQSSGRLFSRIAALRPGSPRLGVLLLPVAFASIGHHARRFVNRPCRRPCGPARAPRDRRFPLWELSGRVMVRGEADSRLNRVGVHASELGGANLQCFLVHARWPRSSDRRHGRPRRGCCGFRACRGGRGPAWPSLSRSVSSCILIASAVRPAAR